MQFGEALYVCFIKDRVIPGHSMVARLTLPVEVRIHHHAFGHKGRTVALVESRVVTRFHLVAEHCGIPDQRASVSPRIWVKQQLVGIESMSCIRLVGPVNAISIESSRPDSRQVTVK